MNELDSASSSVTSSASAFNNHGGLANQQADEEMKKRKEFRFSEGRQNFCFANKKEVEKKIFRNDFSANEEKKLEESNGTRMDLQRNAIKKTLTLTLEGNFTGLGHCRNDKLVWLFGTLMRNFFNLEKWLPVTPQSKHVH